MRWSPTPAGLLVGRVPQRISRRGMVAGGRREVPGSQDAVPALLDATHERRNRVRHDASPGLRGDPAAVCGAAPGVPKECAASPVTGRVRGPVAALSSAHHASLLLRSLRYPRRLAVCKGSMRSVERERIWAVVRRSVTDWLAPRRDPRPRQAGRAPDRSSRSTRRHRRPWRSPPSPGVARWRTSPPRLWARC
jgi:hypothetical protein